MSPLQVSILIHYHCFPSDYRCISLFQKNIVEEFVRKGILRKATDNEYEANGMHYKGTPALSVFMEALSALPLPVQSWTMPDKEN